MGIATKILERAEAARARGDETTARELDSLLEEMEAEADAAAEAAAADEDYRRAFGDMDESPYSAAQEQYNDRLDMGRNDAGEWIGFC